MLRRSILILILGSYITSAIAQINHRTDTVKLNYLISNKINLNDSLPNWDLAFDSAFYQNDLFFLGETHGIKYSYQALWILFRHIHQQVKFRYFLIESGYPVEFFLNRYLDTGNVEFLNTCFDSFKGGFNYNQDTFEFYRKLYRYNQGLDPKDKIKVVGLDYTLNNLVSSGFLKSLLQETGPCQGLPDVAGKFMNKTTKNKDKLMAIYDELYADLLNDRLKYIHCLGPAYFPWEYTLQNITSSWKGEDNEYLSIREDQILDNFNIRNRNLDFKKNKAFAYFGSAHCNLQKTKGFESFSSRINKSDPRLSVVSMVMKYRNCKSLAPVNRTLLSLVLPDINGSVSWAVSNSWDLPAKLWDDTISLINLNKAGSPFRKSGWLVSGYLEGFHTTDYFQYVVVIKDSPAAARFP